MTGILSAWSETCLVSIEPEGYGALLFQAMTETIDPDFGEKGVEYIPILSGGRITKYLPQEDTTITLELYPLYVGTVGWPATGATATATGVFDILDGAADTADPVQVVMDHTRLPIRLSILWTDDTAATNAAGALATSKVGTRMSWADGFMTSVKPSFTDGILKMTVTCKFPAFNKSNTCCSYFESQTLTTTTSLTALTTYAVAGQTTLFK